jgi:hypothetical protein
MSGQNDGRIVICAGRCGAILNHFHAGNQRLQMLCIFD